MDQLVVIWEDSMRKGGLPGGRMCRISSTIFLLLSIFPHTVEGVPSVGFWWSWCLWKAYDVLFGVSQILWEVELGPVRYSLTNRGHQSVFSWWRVIFRPRFWLNRGSFWRFESCTLQLNLSSYLKFQTCGSTRSELKRLCARMSPRNGPVFCQ